IRSTSRRWTCACRAPWVSSLRATTSRPLVSLSRRWTMPGRSASFPPPSMSPSSLTNVGPVCEGAGWTTRPAGLSTTARSASTWMMRSSLIPQPLRSGALYAPVGSKRRTGRALRLPYVGIGEQEDPGGDGDVGEVEGGPVADRDVVGPRVGADAVGEVAESATGEQAGRHPHAGSGRVAREEVADDAERQRCDQHQPGAAAGREAEGDATVVGERQANRADHLDVLAGDQVRLDQRLGRLVEEKNDPGQGAGEAPGPGASGAHP